MLWKFAWSLLYLFPSPPVDRLQQSQYSPVASIPFSDYEHQTQQEMEPLDSQLMFKPIPTTDQEIEEAYEALYGENDMIMPNDFMVDAGIKDTKYRWPGYPGRAEVPYVIDRSLAHYRNIIERSMEQYTELTCVKFVPRTSQKDYIKFVAGKGCKSSVGRQTGEQKVILGRGCYYIGTIVHELGHALGLYHEHQRSDRDQYLTIHRENVARGKGRYLEKTPEHQELLNTEFNYNSIMMYGNYAYSKQPGTLMTMEAKTREPLQDPFNKPGLDDMDIETIKQLYRCA